MKDIAQDAFLLAAGMAASLAGITRDITFGTTNAFNHSVNQRQQCILFGKATGRVHSRFSLSFLPHPFKFPYYDVKVLRGAKNNILVLV